MREKKIILWIFYSNFPLTKTIWSLPNKNNTTIIPSNLINASSPPHINTNSISRDSILHIYASSLNLHSRRRIRHSPFSLPFLRQLTFNLQQILILLHKQHQTTMATDRFICLLAFTLLFNLSVSSDPPQVSPSPAPQLGSDDPHSLPSLSPTVGSPPAPTPSSDLAPTPSSESDTSSPPSLSQWTLIVKYEHLFLGFQNRSGTKFWVRTRWRPEH